MLGDNTASIAIAARDGSLQTEACFRTIALDSAKTATR